MIMIALGESVIAIGSAPPPWSSTSTSSARRCSGCCWSPGSAWVTSPTMHVGAIAAPTTSGADGSAVSAFRLLPLRAAGLDSCRHRRRGSSGPPATPSSTPTRRGGPAGGGGSRCSWLVTGLPPCSASRGALPGRRSGPSPADDPARLGLRACCSCALVACSPGRATSRLHQAAPAPRPASPPVPPR